MNRRAFRDALAASLIWTSAAVVLVVFAWILSDIVRGGWRVLDWGYFTGLPAKAGRSGGIAPILVSTFLLLLVAMATAIPIGLGAAVFLSDFSRRDDTFGAWVRRSLDILAGVPSIVFGLFGLAFFGQFLGWGWSILSGGMTLACMVLPLVIRTTEEGLRGVPFLWRQGLDAVGVSKATALRHVLLPAAAPGVLAGLVLGVGRALAETAAVMYTAGASLHVPRSIWDPGRALSYHIYVMSIEVPGGTERAHAAALVLIVLLAAVNLFSRHAVGRLRPGRCVSP